MKDLIQNEDQSGKTVRTRPTTVTGTILLLNSLNVPDCCSRNGSINIGKNKEFVLYEYSPSCIRSRIRFADHLFDQESSLFDIFPQKVGTSQRREEWRVQNTIQKMESNRNPPQMTTKVSDKNLRSLCSTHFVPQLSILCDVWRQVFQQFFCCTLDELSEVQLHQHPCLHWMSVCSVKCRLRHC